MTRTKQDQEFKEWVSLTESSDYGVIMNYRPCANNPYATAYHLL
jgi:hypothetical protein